jgi:hypothetical protein
MEKNFKASNNKYIIVKGSNIHNKGVFAKKDTPKGTKIIEYVGEKITKKESEKRIHKQYEKAEKNNKEGENYIFDLNKKYDIDGNVPWNIAKYINHSCNKNCEVENIDDELWFISTRNIKKGEEITFNYGFDYKDHKDFPCKCGSKNCIGYILAEEHWPKLNKKD